ncbi:hypothetical protein AVEN_28204-1 [Araneus ventricosus]|uniref:Uncharacterized protein n=1 Tax=Araneus ventricosus TaxID=182803 RepID=A0A4Y2EWH1_ARAVE|nr:hypothetical protein AVEN_28204-1 [Araneus ventricosus]
MDSSAPFPLVSSLRVVGDVNGRPFISHLSPKGPFNDHSPNCLLPPFSEQQPAEIRPTSIKVARSVTAGLGVRVLRETNDGEHFTFGRNSKSAHPMLIRSTRTTCPDVAHSRQAMVRVKRTAKYQRNQSNQFMF